MLHQKTCKTCTLTSVTCRKHSILCLRSMQFCTPTTKDIMHAKSFSIRLHAARRKNLSASRRSSGLSAWNADWHITGTGMVKQLGIKFNDMNFLQRVSQNGGLGACSQEKFMRSAPSRTGISNSIWGRWRQFLGVAGPH